MKRFVIVCAMAALGVSATFAAPPQKSTSKPATKQEQTTTTTATAGETHTQAQTKAEQAKSKKKKSAKKGSTEHQKSQSSTPSKQ